MSSIISRLTLASLLVLGFVTISDAQTSTYAQPGEIRGTVQRVDVSSGTVYFTDGRAVRLDPATRLYVGGREVRLADIQPGWVFVSSGAGTPGTVVVQPGGPPASVTNAPASSTSPAVSSPPASGIASTAPRVVATGVVASVDSATGMITLQDGRVIRMVPGTTVWQPVTVGSVVPGASVFVRNAQPVDFRPSAAAPGSSTTAPQGARPFQMGTVSSVDPSSARVVLSDGTIIHMRPGSQLSFNGQSVMISDLRPGDEVVVGVPAASTATVTSAGPAVSALPRQTLGVIEGEYLYVLGRPQAP
jgi:Cu/Ag efflux protein CusF